MSNPPETVSHELSLSSIWRIILLLALVWFLYELRDIIMILLFAIIIASGVTPFANWLDKKRFPRLLGVALLYLSVFVLIAFVISLMVPFISAQINQLIQDLPNFINKVSDSLDKVQDSRYVDLFSEAQNLLDSASGYLQAFSGSVFGFIVNIFGGLVSFAAIIIISFYLRCRTRAMSICLVRRRIYWIPPRATYRLFPVRSLVLSLTSLAVWFLSRRLLLSPFISFYLSVMRNGVESFIRS